MQNIMDLVEETISTNTSAYARMEAILQLLYGGIFSKRMQLLYSLSNNTALRHTFMEKKTCMRDLWDQLSARVAALLEEGKAAGEFDVALPTTIMVSAFFSLLSPRSFERLMVEGQMSAEEVASDLGRIYFKGIIAN
jgi:TetR/AcrR family fatty acid metabolism transcriptional regulator